MSPNGRGDESSPNFAATPRPQYEGGQKSFSFLGCCFPRYRIEGVGWMAFKTPFNQKDLSQLEIPPLRGHFGRQKKWIKNSGWNISYLLMPSLRTVLHCSSRKSLFDTFIYRLVLLKGKANEASDNEILNKDVEMPCQGWVENPCTSMSRQQPGSSAFEFYRKTHSRHSTASYGVHMY